MIMRDLVVALGARVAREAAGRSCADSTESDVTGEGPGLTRKAECLQGALDRLDEGVESRPVGLHPDHAWAGASWKRSEPADGEVERIDLGRGLGEARRDRLDPLLFDVTEKLQGEVQVAGL